MASNPIFIKVRYSQKNIGNIFIAKQLFCFTILNFVIWIFPPAWSLHSWHFHEACNPAKMFLFLELTTKDSTNNVVSNKKKINIIGWFDILVNKVQDWDWDTTLYSIWTQFQNFNYKIVIWHTVKSRAVDRSTIQFLTIFWVLLTETCY